MAGRGCIYGYLQYTGPHRRTGLVKIKPSLKACPVYNRRKYFPEGWKVALVFMWNQHKQAKTKAAPYPPP